MSENTDLFNLLRKIYLKPNQSQRDLASDLGFSLDTIRAFFSSGIDVLILGKFIVRKEN